MSDPISITNLGTNPITLTSMPTLSSAQSMAPTGPIAKAKSMYKAPQPEDPEISNVPEGATPSTKKVSTSKETKTYLTEEQWDNFNEKAQWDVKVALRGPDSYYGETLKWYTTSVIRGYCSKVFRVGGTVNKDLRLIILPNDHGHSNSYDKTSWNAGHFIEHVELAAYWLKLPTLWVRPDQWHTYFSKYDIRKAGNALLENKYDGENQKAQYRILEKHLKKYTEQGII